MYVEQIQISFLGQFDGWEFPDWARRAEETVTLCDRSVSIDFLCVPGP